MEDKGCKLNGDNKPGSGLIYHCNGLKPTTHWGILISFTGTLVYGTLYVN